MITAGVSMPFLSSAGGASWSSTTLDCGVEFLSKKRLNLLGTIFRWRNAGLSPAVCSSECQCLVLPAHFGASSIISAYHCSLNCRASWHASPDEGSTCDALNRRVSWDAHSLVGSVVCPLETGKQYRTRSFHIDCTSKTLLQEWVKWWQGRSWGSGLHSHDRSSSDSPRIL